MISTIFVAVQSFSPRVTAASRKHVTNSLKAACPSVELEGNPIFTLPLFYGYKQ